ncbi:MAG: aldolase/citrate lyase family protein, partial [Eubacteriales bacterium]|nr:aldolase/citrate lyase family protein [Eubacteriales bacterium]
MRRSMLFIPGNTPNLLMNGDILGADSVIFDLEDAVSPAEKDSARILVRNVLKNLDYSRCEIIVRINPVDTEYWQKDLDEIIPLKPGMIMPPKCSDGAYIRTVSEYIDKLEDKLGFERNTVKLIPLIETALGVENAYEIASACDRVEAIFLGAEDLTSDMRC